MERKPDSYYGNVSLEDDRMLQTGYIIDSIKSGDTDVEMIKKIIDSYIKVDTIQDVNTFMDYKIDFAINFLDTMYLVLMEKLKVVTEYYNEVEKQRESFDHLFLKPVLTGSNISKEEKIKIYDEYASVMVNRRNTKDEMTMLKVIIDNIEKSRNFILGMNKRQYSSKSKELANNDNFKIPSKIQMNGN